MSEWLARSKSNEESLNPNPLDELKLADFLAQVKHFRVPSSFTAELHFSLVRQLQKETTGKPLQLTID